MTATVSASMDANIPSDQSLALSLWTFVHLQIPAFSSAAALDVIRELEPFSDNEIKPLAKRLRSALAGHGVAIKHVHALEAAARMLGHRNWHSANRVPLNERLKLTVVGMETEEVFTDWRQITPRLCYWCDLWQQEHQAKVFEIRFGQGYVMVGVSGLMDDNNQDIDPALPLFFINPIGPTDDWLLDAPAAFEGMRRHLEESGRAALDGVAVLQLCNVRREPMVSISQPVSPMDACNSELVLLREDSPLYPGSGFEIARGDEMACWSQLELALKDIDPAEISLIDGAWCVGAARFVWELSTIHPNDYIPGLVITCLSDEASEKLWRRYKLVKRTLSDSFKHREVTKRLQYLSGPADTYRVDLHKTLLLLNEAGLTWEEYCQEAGMEQVMEPILPLAFVLALVERLKPKDPDVLFARPNRSELARADDDALLRSLLPRVDHVRYRLTRGVSAAVQATVREAIEKFSMSIRLQALTAAGRLTSEGDDPLPYLVFASDAEELRLKLEEERLVMYVGVMPHLVPTDSIRETMPNVMPYAFGHSLFLDIDRVDDA